MFCGNCGSQLPDTAKFCHNCGAKTPETDGVICPACSEKLPLGARFCKSCGTSIAAPEPTVVNTANNSSAAPAPVTVNTAQTAQPVAIPVQDVHPAAQDVQLPSFLTMSPSATESAPSAPVAVPPAPTPKKRKKKKGGGALVFFIILILLAVAGAALYFTMFSDDARIAKLTEQAEECMQRNDYEGAAAAYEDCIIIGTQDAEIYLSLADVYEEDEKPEKALEALRKGFAVTGSEEIWERFAQLEDELGDNEND